MRSAIWAVEPNWLPYATRTFIVHPFYASEPVRSSLAAVPGAHINEPESSSRIEISAPASPITMGTP